MSVRVGEYTVIKHRIEPNSVAILTDAELAAERIFSGSTLKELRESALESVRWETQGDDVAIYEAACQVLDRQDDYLTFLLESIAL